MQKKICLKDLKSLRYRNLNVSERVASRTGAEKPLSYLLCEAKALKIRLSLKMNFIRYYNINITKHLTY
jgi:hypothetical protein